MATIESIIKNRKGAAHAWRVERCESDPFVGTEYQLWHYSTMMLHWLDRKEGSFVIAWQLGRGSVSDQNGMNTAFKVLELAYRYDRAGRARITHTVCGKEWMWECQCRGTENTQIWGMA